VSKCGDIANNEMEQRRLDFMETQAQLEGFESEFGYRQFDGKMGRLKQIITDAFKSDRPLSQKDIDWATKKYAKEGRKFRNKKGGEQARAAFEITGILLNNEHLQSSFNDYMIEEIVSRGIEGISWDDTDGKRVPVLDTIPLTVLRVFHGQLYGWINGGRQFKQVRGVFGNFEYEFMSPKQAAKLDPSGLMYKVNAETEAFASRSQGFANKFIETFRRTKDLKTYSETDFGFKSITEGVDQWSVNHDIPRDQAWRFFSDVMDGKAILQKDGATFEYSEHVPIKGIWTYINPVDFVYPDLEGKETVLKLSQLPGKEGELSQFHDFVRLVNQARFMFKDIGESAQSSIRAIKARQDKALARAEKYKLKEYMDQKLEPLIDTELEVGGLNAAELKKGKYYPKMHYNADIPMLYDRGAIDQERILEAKLNAIKEEPDPKKRNEMLQDVIAHRASLEGMKAKSNMIMDPNTVFDPITDSPVRTSVWWKNMKNITHVFDKYGMNRKEEFVMTDYVNQVSQQTARNESALKIYEDVLEAKINGANENTINASAELYNTVFYNRNADSQLFGAKQTAEKWASRLNNIPFNSATEEGVTRAAKKFSALSTFTALWGPTQGIQNLSAALLKADISGSHTIYQAVNEYYGAKKSIWQKRVAESGIATLAEFVDTYFSSELRPAELAATRAARTRIRGLVKRQEQLLKNAHKKGGVNKVALAKHTKDLKKYRTYLKTLKSKTTRAKYDALAQWAIRRNTTYGDNPTFWNRMRKATGTFTLDWYPSIGSTEIDLRSLSYIIGVKKALSVGYADTETSRRAVEMGKRYALLTDFGLTQASVGAGFRGPVLGGFINKMRIWHQQKAGFDSRLLRDWSRSVTPLGKMRKFRIAANMPRLFLSTYTTDSLNKIWRKIISGGTSQPLLAQRKVNPFSAAGYSGNLRMGIITGMLDLWLYAPGSTALLMGVLPKRFLQGQAVRGIQGAGSSAISSALLASTILHALFTGEEDQDWDEYVSKWGRKWVGIGGNWMINIILGVSQNLGLADKYPKRYTKEHWKRVSDTIVTKPGTEYVVEPLADILKRR